jgi:hypothetical protein
MTPTAVTSSGTWRVVDSGRWRRLEPRPPDMRRKRDTPDTSGNAPSPTWAPIENPHTIKVHTARRDWVLGTCSAP